MAKSIIKWAGGKRQLLPILREMMPDRYNRYYEPFFGGGALFFEVEPGSAVIGDTNRELVNVYLRVRRNPRTLMKMLSCYQEAYNALQTKDEKSEFYYRLRDEFNRRLDYKRLCSRDAALFIFLNKACYNGLYRVNSRGLFNTPTAGRQRISLFSEADITEGHRLLKSAEIVCGDFEETCRSAQAGDFVYFDSPYYNTFDTYQAGGFGESEHRRLAGLFRSLTEKGAYCLLSNSDSEFIRDLYRGFDIHQIESKCMINSDASNRVWKELIIKNY